MKPCHNTLDKMLRKKGKTKKKTLNCGEWVWSFNFRVQSLVSHVKFEALKYFLWIFTAIVEDENAFFSESAFYREYRSIIFFII